MLTVSLYIGSDQPLGSSGGHPGRAAHWGRPNERYTEAIIRLNKIFSIEVNTRGQKKATNYPRAIRTRGFLAMG